ncbi:MAG: hypothetical protein M1821_006809 [Bathelium mastoideum]|nr:MAG: hypothetical protein M1821_006809 [Bathelium mastoideum]
MVVMMQEEVEVEAAMVVAEAEAGEVEVVMVLEADARTLDAVAMKVDADEREEVQDDEWGVEAEIRKKNHDGRWYVRLDEELGDECLASVRLSP